MRAIATHVPRFVIYLSVCLSVCVCVCLSFYLSVCLSDCLSVCLSIYHSDCLSVCVHDCLLGMLISLVKSVEPIELPFGDDSCEPNKLCVR